MEKKLILRGLLAGALAGLLAFVFARVFAEPLIDRAIAYEDGRAAAQATLDTAAGFAVEADSGEPLVSRGMQAGAGLGVGMLIFGVAMGVLFAVAYAVCLGRTGRIRPRPLALLLGAAGFVTVSLIPFLKYPASPPAASADDTIRDRTGLFLLVVLLAVILAVVATVVGQRLRPRFGTWNAALMAGAGFTAAVAVIMAAFPPLGHLAENVAATGAEHATETPRPLRDDEGYLVFPGFPADVLAEFRVYSLGMHLLLWSAVAVIFAPLADKLLAGGERPVTAPREEIPAH
ncbi:MAG: CbtA family protein [Sporichthyaceae bacterium]